MTTQTDNEKLEKLFSLFNKAKTSGNKRTPSIVIGGAGQYTIYLATAASRYEGSLIMMYGDDWIGRINPDFTMVLSRLPERRSLFPDIKKHLHDFLNDPAAYAKQFGDNLICCMFCSRPLSEDSSRHFGYGPICAVKWGLPHGKQAMHQAEIDNIQFDMPLDGEKPEPVKPAPIFNAEEVAEQKLIDELAVSMASDDTQTLLAKGVAHLLRQQQDEYGIALARTLEAKL